MSQKAPREDSELRRKLREYQEQQRREQATRASRRPPEQKPQPPPRRPPASPPQRPQVGRPPAAPPRRPRPLGVYIPWWGILVVVGIVGAATCGVWAFVLTTSPDVTGTDLAAGLTPTFVVITNTPTPGQPEPLEATPDVPEAPPTPEVEEAPPTETAPDSEIVVGSEVTILGTEGDGLAMRQGPGLSYAYFFIGQDGEVFLVEDGPRENDGFIWWYITDPEIPDKGGWAVQDYMEKVPEPGPLQEVTPEPTAESEASG